MSPVVIRSTYLRQRLVADPPNDTNLDVYSDLLRLENLLVERPKNWIAGMAYQALRLRYPEAFAAISREIAPDLYQEHVVRERRLKTEVARFTRERSAARRKLLRGLQRAAKALQAKRPPRVR